MKKYLTRAGEALTAFSLPKSRGAAQIASDAAGGPASASDSPSEFVNAL
ncbi:hypothetical protein NE236_19760 [Actinoallomurus purpureus]|nr:hypothetical protein [Actinoallomurus purpureus]MCO6007220.1 hypothetical protein [Actinoallomurus purpureus]